MPDPLGDSAAYPVRARDVREVIESVPAVIEFDLQGHVVRAAPDYLESFGYTPEEAVGAHHRLFCTPEYANSAEYEAFWAKLAAGEHVSGEFLRQHRNGDAVWIQGSYAPILGVQGKPLKIVKFAKDVTREKLRAIDVEGQIAAVERAHAVVEFAVDGTVLRANQNYLELMGYAEDQVIGRHHRMFCSPEHAASERYQAFWARLEAGDHVSCEFQRFAAEGREVWLQGSYNPILGPDGRVLKIVKFATNITTENRERVDLGFKVEQLLETLDVYAETKEIRLNVSGMGAIGRLGEGLSQFLQENAEQERSLDERNRALEHAAVELQRSNEELGDFAYIASHDLKEPLRGIGNLAMFLVEDVGDDLDAESRTRLERMMHLTKRLESLIDGLLYYSRVGRTELAYRDVDLKLVVDDVLDSLDFSIQEKGVVVRCGDLPTVWCDAARVGEVFRNLISNAIKYNDDTEPWIEIGCERRGAGDPYAFYVRDNGIGIRAKHRDSVFRIFKRLHARDRFGGGTGAGLTITKKIVERHGGQIRVDSTSGEGSTFHFTLPAGPAEGRREPAWRRHAA